MMEEFIAITTSYNAGVNRTPRKIIRAVIDGSTPFTSGTRSVHGSGISDVCPSPPPCAPPSVLCNNIIGNIRQTTTPNLRYINELTSPIDRSLTNDTIELSVSSQILSDEFPDSSSYDLSSRCRMNFAEETGQTVAPQFLIHGIPTIDTLDENCGIRSPTTIIRRMLNITYLSMSEHAVGQETAVRDAVA